jgi:hypothetical protein
MPASEVEKMRGPENSKIKLKIIFLCVGSIAVIRQWLVETGLRGWACEIRTQKCRRKLSL